MMNIQSKWFAAAAVALLAAGIAPPAATATNVWFGGGWYDGYDGTRAGGAPDYPQVNNAVGATNVTIANAWLTGTLLATGGAPAKVVVYWAKEDGGTNVTAWAEAVGGDNYEFGGFGDVEPFELLSHEIAVDEGSDYYYRFFATNELGHTGWAYESAVFQTPAAPVVITGPGASPVGMKLAVLHGELTAGIEADVEIHWGEAADTEPPGITNIIEIGPVTELGTAEQPNPFEKEITNLSPGTGHAYRIWAANQHGTNDSGWVWFSTVPAPQDFSPEHGQEAWFGGGDYDGYSRWILKESPLPGSGRGTMFCLG